MASTQTENKSWHKKLTSLLSRINDIMFQDLVLGAAKPSYFYFQPSKNFSHGSNYSKVKSFCILLSFKKCIFLESIWQISDRHSQQVTLVLNNLHYFLAVGSIWAEGDKHHDLVPQKCDIQSMLWNWLHSNSDLNHWKMEDQVHWLKSPPDNLCFPNHYPICKPEDPQNLPIWYNWNYLNPWNKSLLLWCMSDCRQKCRLQNSVHVLNILARVW